MDIFKITGGSRLVGEASVSGAKNAILPILCASILADSPSVFRNVPDLKDVRTMLDILNSLGANARFTGENTIEVDPRSITRYEAPYEMVKKMRASICILGPLAGKFGNARVSLPGGCVIGPRPVDMHIKGLTAMGYECRIEHGYIDVTGRAQGGNVFLGGRFGSSVTGTANLLMASVLGKSVTIIESAAMEPEVQDLAEYLNRMGARISGIGSYMLRVDGVHSLHGAEYTIIPDRIEAGTFMLGAAITLGDLYVRGAKASHLRALTDKLSEAGVNISPDEGGIRVVSLGRPAPVDVITHPFPGFPTDLQAQMMALLSLSEGIALVTEKVYPERFMHIAELNRMGANISLEGQTAVIKGVKALSGAPVMASDLRASAALLMAALVAEGESVIDRVYHIDRGYENIEKKLNAAGARIERIKQSSG